MSTTFTVRQLLWWTTILSGMLGWLTSASILFSPITAVVICFGLLVAWIDFSLLLSTTKPPTSGQQVLLLILGLFVPLVLMLARDRYYHFDTEDAVCVFASLIFVLLGAIALIRWAFQVGIILVCAGSIGVVVSLPGISHGARNVRYSPQYNFQQVASALREYHQVYGQYPPLVVKSPTGKPLYSWRVCLCEQLGYTYMLERFDFNDTWDSAKNLAVVGNMPRYYHSTSEELPLGYTRMQAVVSESSLWGKPDHALGSQIMIVEGNKAVPWTQPDDLSEEDVIKMFSQVPKGHRKEASFMFSHTVHGVTQRDSVLTIHPHASPDQLRRLMRGAVPPTVLTGLPDRAGLGHAQYVNYRGLTACVVFVAISSTIIAYLGQQIARQTLNWMATLHQKGLLA